MEEDEEDWLFIESGTTPEKAKSIPHLSTSPGDATNENSFSSYDSLFEPTGDTPENANLPQRRPFQLSKAKCGRKRKMDQYPTLIAVLTEYMTRQGFSAHRSRGTEGISGVKLDDALAYVKKVLPGLKIDGLAITAIRRYCIAPNKNHRAAKLCKGLIPARIPKKKNDSRSVHEDSHVYQARVKLLRQYGSYFEKGCLVLSCDNKNKVNVGSLAVSRRIKITKIYPVDDAPNYPDHDFPLRNNKIIPMGYMMLEDKIPKGFTDRLGRRQVHCLKVGEVFIINRAQEFHNSTIAQHVEDLLEIGPLLLQGKKILILVTDNGPDWTTRSLANIYYFYLLWRELKLDSLFIVSFAPQNSAKNPIERGWSPCTTAMTSLKLDATLPGESVPPGQQKIEEALKRKKQALVMDAAMIRLSNIFSDIKTPEYTFRSFFRRSLSQREQEVATRYKGIQAKLNNVGTTVKDKELFADLKTMNAHLDRRGDMLIVKKCKSCHHCTQNPPADNPAFQFLMRNKHFPSAVPSEAYPGHFHTFMDYLNGAVPYSSHPDITMVRTQKLKANLGSGVRCIQCRYNYTSKTDKMRHQKLFHS